MPAKVVRIIDRLNIGGPAKHVTWLSAGLNHEEFTSVLITGTVPPREGDMGFFARAVGIEPIVIKEMSRELNPADILVIFKLVRLLLHLKPQIVHTHKAKAGAVGRIAVLIYKLLTPSKNLLRTNRCITVHTYHGHIFHSYYGPSKTRVFLWIERFLAKFCTDRIVTVSPRQRVEINQQFKVGRREQFEVIPLGIDFEESSLQEAGQLRAELQIGRDVPLIGTVGRLCEVKNPSMFIEAAASLCQDDSTTRFVVIGDGHLRDELEALAATRGVGERVKFLGFRQDAMALYKDFDIAALTSLNEGTPLTLIEAMSRGCAIASTEVGGVVDLMGEKRDTIDGFTIWDHGVTVPSRDSATFAKALKFLIKHPSLRQEMGRQGLHFTRSQLSKDRLISDMEKLYRQLLQ